MVYFIICHKTFVLECLNVISHCSKARLESMGVPTDSALLSAGIIGVSTGPTYSFCQLWGRERLVIPFLGVGGRGGETKSHISKAGLKLANVYDTSKVLGLQVCTKTPCFLKCHS